MIKEVSVKNFKSIIQDRVVLSDFSIIVGKNGAGKSNFIQAVAFLRDIIVGYDVWDSAEKSILTPRELFNRAGTSNECVLSTRIKNGDDIDYEYTVSVALDEKTNSISKLVIINEKLSLIQTSGLKSQVFERRGNEIFDENNSLILIDIGPYNTAISLLKNIYANKVRSLFRNTHLPINDIVSSVQIGDTKPIADKVAQLIVRLKKSDGDKYERFLKMCKKLIPSISSFIDIAQPQSVLSSDDNADQEYLVLFEEENLKGRLSMKAISHGDIKTMYYLAAAVLSEKGTVFFFEEIENGIHPSRVVNIVEYLERIAIREEKQFVFTTHSPRIINCISPNKVIFVQKDQRGTKLTPLAEGGDIQKIQEVLNSGGELSEVIDAKG